MLLWAASVDGFLAHDLVRYMEVEDGHGMGHIVAQCTQGYSHKSECFVILLSNSNAVYGGVRLPRFRTHDV